jgi:hypothetical protein
MQSEAHLLVKWNFLPVICTVQFLLQSTDYEVFKLGNCTYTVPIFELHLLTACILYKPI